MRLLASVIQSNALPRLDELMLPHTYSDDDAADDEALSQEEALPHLTTLHLVCHQNATSLLTLLEAREKHGHPLTDVQGFEHQELDEQDQAALEKVLPRILPSMEGSPHHV